MSEIIQTAGRAGDKLRDKYLSENFGTTPTNSLPDRHAVSQLRELLLPALFNLEYVEQPPRYHPEGDVLYHSLQVFERAYNATQDPELWAAALLHDIGKAVDVPRHDKIGAEMLDGLFPERVVWLVEHHLDLLKHPAKTRRRLKGTARLRDLEQLRKWDLGGRLQGIDVISPEEALDIVLNAI